MEPRFIVQTANSDKLAAQMARFTCLRSFPLNRRVRLLCICSSPFLLVLLLRLLFAPPLTALDGIIALIGLIPCAMIFFLFPRRLLRMYQNSFKECEGEITIHTFFEDHYTCERSGEISSIPYAAFKGLEETLDAFAILLTDSDIAFLPKDAFILGTSETFRTFFKEKIGKDFISLK